jgi:AraC-like DNA-binding protein
MTFVMVKEYIGMSEEIIKISSISQLHDLMGFEKPKHPLISIVDVSKMEMGEEWVGKKFSMDLYSISLKDKGCGLDYGRNHFDFNEGVLIFTGPNRVASVTKTQELNEIQGWMLFFHPDLIRTTPLGEHIDDYSFFNYGVHEALHLAESEEQTLNGTVAKIQEEYNERIDNHSHRVIVSSLDLLLNYCLRFYERQFNTRTAKNKDVLGQVEDLLKEYYKTGQLTEYGPLSVNYLATKVNLSHNYLSDLLKKETGRSAKDHINDFLVNKAKTKLLNSESSISEIAYSLGFNYPHYFSRLFKSKTGVTPQKYRQSQL